MVTLDKLMQLDGAMAAFRFSDRGEFLEHQVADGSELDETVLDLLAHVCVANIAIATMQARGWEKMTGMGGFYPVHGFSMVGFEWTAIVNSENEYGVVVPNAKADFEAAYAILEG